MRGVAEPSEELTIFDCRGPIALIDAVRASRVLNTMTSTEAAKARIDDVDRRLHFRMDDGKGNRAKPTATALVIARFLARGPKGSGRISLSQDSTVSLQYAGEPNAAFIKLAGGRVKGEISAGTVPEALKPVYVHRQSRTPFEDPRRDRATLATFRLEQGFAAGGMGSGAVCTAVILSRPYPLWFIRRTFECVRDMSALPLKTDIRQGNRDVRFVPEAEVRGAA